MSKTIWALLNSKMGCRMGWFAGSRIHGSWVMGRPKRHIYKVYGSDFYSFFQTPFSLFSSYYPRSLSSQSSSPMRMGGSRRRLPAGGGGAAAGNPFFLIFFLVFDLFSLPLPDFKSKCHKNRESPLRSTKGRKFYTFAS